MPNLNDICREIVETTDFALAAAVIDQDSGLLLGISHNVPYFTQTFLDSIAASSVELFRGKGVQTIEKMIADLRNQEPRRSIQEMQISTEDSFHFMTVVPDKVDILVVLVARKTINLGMGWSSLRSRLKDIAAACP